MVATHDHQSTNLLFPWRPFEPRPKNEGALTDFEQSTRYYFCMREPMMHCVQ